MKGRFGGLLKIVGITAFVVIVLSEISFRVFFFEQLKTKSYPLIYRPDDSTGYEYIPNMEAKICIPSICKEFQINNQGYYGPDFSQEKKDGVYRIAIVGSSDAGGIWLDSEKSFAMILQELFRNNGYPNVEVNNFSVDGQHRGLFNVRLIRDKVIQYEPDLVLFGANIPFVFGDVRRDLYKGYVMVYSTEASKKYCKDKIDYIEAHGFLKVLYDISYIVRAAARYYMNNHHNPKSHNIEIYSQRRVEAPGIGFRPFSVMTTVNLLKGIQERLAAQGSTLLLMTYYNDEKYHQTAARHDLPSISLDMLPTREIFHQYDGHFNGKGHEMIAQRLFDRLIKLNIVPAP